MVRVRIPNTTLDVYPLCLGGGPFGWTANEQESIGVLNSYFEMGGNFVDTADMYADGTSEIIIGKWLSDGKRRESLVVATKVGIKSDRRGLRLPNIINACDESLRRLRTDYIDIYFAHEDDLLTQPSESIEAFNLLAAAGKIRYFGASNFTSERLLASLQSSRDLGVGSYVLVQDRFNLVERKIYETGIKKVVQEYGLTNLPYFSLAKGFLTGKYRRETSAAVSASAHGQIGVTEYMQKRYFRVIDQLSIISNELKCSISAVALAWLRAQPSVSIPIASARTVEQLSEIVQIVDLKLDHLDQLNELSATLERPITKIVDQILQAIRRV